MSALFTLTNGERARQRQRYSAYLFFVSNCACLFAVMRAGVFSGTRSTRNDVLFMAKNKPKMDRIGKVVNSTQADDRKLIRLVKSRKVLYAKSKIPVTGVKNKWREVAQAMGWSGKLLTEQY